MPKNVDLNEYMADQNGNLVPIANIKDMVLQEHNLVITLFEEAQSIAGTLADFRRRALAAIDDHQAELARHSKAKIDLEKEKQRSKSLSTFDKSLEIRSTFHQFKEYNGHLSIAKGLLDNIIKRLANDADPILIAIVNDVFAVDGAAVSGVKLNALRKYEVPDPDWNKAMAALSEAEEIVNSKRYVNVYYKDEDGKKQRLPLDIAAQD
jgi:hypothetical protein